MSAPPTMGWWRAGEQFLAGALDRLDDDGFADPSLLPGWTRHYLLAHVARNADALVNLLTWARTGVETPMYASPEDRQAGIAEAAGLSPAQLRGEVAESADRLVAAAAQLPGSAWDNEVRTAQGRTVTAALVPWMRCREVWVHPVDLACGVGFDEVPDDVSAALVDDVFTMWGRRDELPDVRVQAGGRSWGDGAQTVHGSLAGVTGWVSGRADGSALATDAALPRLPRWL